MGQSDGQLTVHQNSVVQFGWADEEPKRVFRKPYACLVRGAMDVKRAEDHRALLAVGVRKIEHKTGILHVPIAWLKGTGVAYRVEGADDLSGFRISQVTGTVSVTNQAGRLVGKVGPGQEKRFSFANMTGR